MLGDRVEQVHGFNAYDQRDRVARAGQALVAAQAAGDGLALHVEVNDDLVSQRFEDFDGATDLGVALPVDFVGGADVLWPCLLYTSRCV